MCFAAATASRPTAKKGRLLELYTKVWSTIYGRDDTYSWIKHLAPAAGDATKEAHKIFDEVVITVRCVQHTEPPWRL